MERKIDREVRRRWRRLHLQRAIGVAATILTALVPLVVYFGSGRWFVRGIASGAVKG